MRAFYLTAAVLVVALVVSPWVLLRGRDTRRFAGQVVSYGTYGSKIRSLDPATCGDTTSASFQGSVFESLYGYHYLKRPPALVPVLAESMPEVSGDGLTYTIHVRKDVTYARNPCFGRDADGRPLTRAVTAEDFVLAFKRIADFHMPVPMALAFIEGKLAGLEEYRARTRAYHKGEFARYDLPLEGVRALDEHTLQIRLTEPFPQLTFVLALHNFAPIPREVVDYYLARRAGGEPLPLRERSSALHDAAAMVGTGPYFVETFVEGGDIVFVRNPDYRDAFYPSEGEPGDAEKGLLDDAGKKLPFIDVLHWTYVSEDNAMWKLFLTRQVDASGIPRQVYHQVITPGKELTDEWGGRGIHLVKYTSPVVYWMAFNLRNPALGSSKSLRQALCLGFDVETYIDVLHNGRGIRAVNTLPSSFEGYREAGPGPYARFDLAEARRKLEQARHELVAAGVLRPGQDLPPLTLDIGGRDEEDRRMGEFIQKQFRRLGIDLKVELNDWPTLQQKVDKKECQLFTMGWQADYPDPENFLQLYYTPNIKRGTNSTNYSSTEFDRLYEQASKMDPSPERTALYARMVRLLGEDCPVLLLSEPVSFVLVHPWVHNDKPQPFGYGAAQYRRIDVQARRKAGGR